MDQTKLFDLQSMWSQRPYREALISALNFQADDRLEALRSAVSSGNLIEAAKAEGSIQALKALPSMLDTLSSRARS